jgi:hypothetical protein
MTDEPLGRTQPVLAISNRQFVARLEFAVTYRKQSLHTDSNRHIWDSPTPLSRSFQPAATAPHEFLIATQPDSKNGANP